MNIPVSVFRILREILWVTTDNLTGCRDSKLPCSISAITPEWLTDVLQAHVEGVQVKSVEPLSEVSGTTTHARIALTYNEVGEKAGLPGSMFLKLPPREFATKVFVSLFDLARNETRFYNEIGPEIQSLVPKAYYAKSKDRGAKFILVFEDLEARGYRFIDVTSRCTLDEAKLVIRALGNIHGKYWESPRLQRDLAWLPTYRTDKNVRLNRLMRKWALKRTLAKFGDIIPDPVKESGHYINQRYDDLEEYWAQPPQTFIHGDSHVGNMYFSDQNMGFLDWQVVRQGQGMRDVSYFMVASLPTEVRRAHERDLIRLYLDCLTETGVSNLDFEQAWEQHRLHTFYTWIAQIVTAAAGTLQLEPIVRAGLTRTATAIIDLDSLNALKNLQNSTVRTSR